MIDNKIEINLKEFPKISYKPYYMTYIDAVVINIHTQVSSVITHEFIFDTGAAITILNAKFAYLFEDTDTPVITYQHIQYGGNVVKLPIYEINIVIKGQLFKLPAAFDKDMKLTSLLGHLGFLNELEHYWVSKKRRKLTIIT